MFSKADDRKEREESTNDIGRENTHQKQFSFPTLTRLALSFYIPPFSFATKLSALLSAPLGHTEASLKSLN
jgi:hypothetical protein